MPFSNISLIDSTTNFTHKIIDLPHQDDIHQQIDVLVSRVNMGQMLFGIIGNLICICVFKNKALLKKRFNWYLLILAFIDCIFCAIVFLNYLVYNIKEERALYDLSKFTCYFTDFIVNSVDEYSVFLTLLLSIDRLNAIINPIRNKFFITNRYQKQLTIIGIVLITLANSPYFYLSQRTYIIPSNHHHHHPLVKKSTSFQNSKEIWNIHYRVNFVKLYL